jgi:hypothetical protein
MPRSRPTLPGGVALLALLALLALGPRTDAAPLHQSNILFAPESWHNHASCVVELPNGDLLACWFHGSGERTADDVKVEGARLRRGAKEWGPRFTLADTPGFPDCNPAMFLDPRGRLWLVWITIQSNRWESSLLKFRRSDDFLGAGPPRWNESGVIHLKPPEEFAAAVLAHYDRVEPVRLAAASDETARGKVREEFATYRSLARDRLSQRLGWMPRAHPLVLEGRRIILPLYSDGFDLSLMALSDDGGETWRTSTPVIGEGNIQPSIVRRRDGSLYTVMRDNGPPPKRLLQSESRDGGETWSAATDSAVPNPGSGAEIIGLRDGLWALISNDTETAHGKVLGRRGPHLALAARAGGGSCRTVGWSLPLPQPDRGGRWHTARDVQPSRERRGGGGRRPAQDDQARALQPGVGQSGRRLPPLRDGTLAKRRAARMVRFPCISTTCRPPFPPRSRVSTTRKTSRRKAARRRRRRRSR